MLTISDLPGVLFWAVANALLSSQVSGVQLSRDDEGAPVSIHLGTHQIQLGGAFLISPVNMIFINNTCNQVVSNLMITSKSLTAILSSKVLNTFSHDLSYIRRISFFCVTLETTYYNIIKYLGRVLLCKKDTLRETEVIYAEIKGKLDLIWVELQPGIRPGEDARPQAFVI